MTSSSSTLSPLSLLHVGAISRFYNNSNSNSNNSASSPSSLPLLSSIISNHLIPLCSDLERNVIPRLRHQFVRKDRTPSFDEDDIICNGLGDWETSIMQNPLSMMSDLLVESEPSLLDKVKIAILGVKNCSSSSSSSNNSTTAASTATSASSVLSKATRKHRRKVETLLHDCFPDGNNNKEEEEDSSSATTTTSYEECRQLASTLRDFEFLIIFGILIKLLDIVKNSKNSNKQIADWVCAVVILKSMIVSSGDDDDAATSNLMPPSWLEMIKNEESKSVENQEQKQRFELLVNTFKSSAALQKKLRILQNFARVIIAKRKRRLLQKEKTKKMKQLHTGFINNSSPTAVQEDSSSSHQTFVVKKVLDRELRVAELSDYLENEPEKFKASWRDWENKMKNFYMNECELDPQQWKAVQVKDENNNNNNEPQVRYLSLQTGKLQVEHPHRAKIFQIKQRQFLAATRTREATIGKAQKEMKDIEQMEIGTNGSLSMEMARLRKQKR